MKTDIRIGIVGTVTNSSRRGHQVRIVDDAEATGGFLVYEWWTGSDGPNQAGAFDDWVPDRAALERFLHESQWQVTWLDAG